MKSLGAVVIPVEIRRRVFTKSFCFVHLFFVCLFFEGQGGTSVLKFDCEMFRVGLNAMLVVFFVYFFFPEFELHYIL